MFKLISINVKNIYHWITQELNSNYIKTQNPYVNKFIEESNSELKNLQERKIQYINIQELLCSEVENNFTKRYCSFYKDRTLERLANYLKNNIKELNNAI